MRSAATFLDITYYMLVLAGICRPATASVTNDEETGWLSAADEHMTNGS
jgi:hypothetical protein